MSNPALLGRKRAAVQWLTTLTLLGVPFAQVQGESLFRLDFPSLSLFAFGLRFPITDLSLFLLLGLALTLLFLLITLTFGRAWCGWACPQTTLVDLAEWFARRIGVKVKGGNMTATRVQTLILHLFYAGLSLLVASNLVWYFVSPYSFFPQLIQGRLHWVTLLTLAVVAGTTYLDLGFVRRLVCREFCPYGRFQSVLVDSSTLILHYHPDESARCIRCGACVRVCPTGIDIRNGDQIECINCGRCLDACRTVMGRLGQPGIIRYTFGLEGRGLKALINPRLALVGLALIILMVGLLVAATQRDPVTLKIARNSELLPRLVGQQQVANFFTAYLTNRSSGPLSVRLQLAGPDQDLILSGPTDWQQLIAGEKRRVDFAIQTARQSLAQPRAVELLILDDKGQHLARTGLYLTGPMEAHD